MIKQTIKVRDLDAIAVSVGKLRTIKNTAIAIATLSLEDALLKHMEVVTQRQVAPHHEDTIAWNKEYKEIIVDNYAKDEKGNILNDANGRPRIKDITHFNLEVGKLASKYPEYYAVVEQFENEYAEFIESEIEIEYANLLRKDIGDNLSLDELLELSQYWNILGQPLSL